MRHGSLFSGIGGFDLAAEWMGWENVFHCEWNEFGQKVLKHYWPDAVSLSDIHDAKFKRDERGNVWVRVASDPNRRGHDTAISITGIHKCDDREPISKNFGREKTNENGKIEEWIPIGPIDIITGGFPCQPFSMAGKRKGTADDRHLWPEMLRVIREVQPTFVVGENVPGLVNWDGGVVFDQVQVDLETEGYDVIPFILPACGVGAPHRRDRIWFVGYAHRIRGESRETYIRNKFETLNGRETSTPFTKSKDGSSPHPDQCIGCKGGMHTPRPGQAERHIGTRNTRFDRSQSWHNFPTQPPVCGRTYGFSDSMDRNWNIVKHYYAEISKDYSIEILRNLRERVQSEILREQIGGLWQIYDKEILLEIMLCFEKARTEGCPGVQQEDASVVFGKAMQRMRKWEQLANTPQGRKLEEQFPGQLDNIMCIMPHEIALAAMAIQEEYKAFSSKHRNESIKAYGNAIVPNVAYQIFKAIEQFNEQN